MNQEIQEIQDLENTCLKMIQSIETEDELNQAKSKIFGKKGILTQSLKALGNLEPELRRERGKHLNILQKNLKEKLQEKTENLQKTSLESALKNQRIDITLPPRPETTGTIHPVSQVIEEVISIFHDLDFDLREGPEIETQFHNFDALNIPPNHPAREMHDTFFFEEKEKGKNFCLRTHTSPVQIRELLKTGPPVRFIAPGRTYRCDSDLTHTPMFHQVEGIAIDRSITMSNLRWVLEEFCKKFFENPKLELRFRPDHFPFTEPSMEVDIRCSWKDGNLILGEGEDWLEILGSGMVHPNVLQNCSINPNEWQGFAFGIGIDRLAMLKYGIPDLRDFFDNDIRWLKHFGFQALDIPASHV